MDQTGSDGRPGTERLGLGAVLGAGIPLVAFLVNLPEGLGVYALGACLLVGICLVAVQALRMLGLGLILGGVFLVVGFVTYLNVTGLELS